MFVRPPRPPVVYPRAPRQPVEDPLEDGSVDFRSIGEVYWGSSAGEIINKGGGGGGGGGGIVGVSSRAM